MEKCPSYRGFHLTIVRLVEVFYEKHTNVLPGHVKVSVLDRCPSYGMSVLRGCPVQSSPANPISQETRKNVELQVELAGHFSYEKTFFA